MGTNEDRELATTPAIYPEIAKALGTASSEARTQGTLAYDEHGRDAETAALKHARDLIWFRLEYLQPGATPQDQDRGVRDA